MALNLAVQALLPVIHTYGYLFVFIIMFFEGPIITYVAAFASYLGFFNPLIILLLSILGNVLPDLIYYAIGNFTKKVVLYKFFARRKIKKKKALYIEHLLKNHTGKMMLFIKVIPSLPMIGLVLAGMVVPFKKFFKFSLLISGIYSLIFFILGFYSGKAYTIILNYFKVGEIILGVLAALIFIIWLLVRYWLRKNVKI